MDDQREFRLRRTAIRWGAKGVKSNLILKKVHRSRAWLSKYRGRFQRLGLRGLKSQPRRPHRSPTACPARIVRLIVQTRCRLVKQKVGLIGPKAILRELAKLRLGKQRPSEMTVKRVMRAQGLIRTSGEAPPAYFPAPSGIVTGTLQAVDWTCRYLADGPTVA